MYYLLVNVIFGNQIYVWLLTPTQGTNPVSMKPWIIKMVVLDPLNDDSNIVDGSDVLRKIG